MCIDVSIDVLMKWQNWIQIEKLTIWAKHEFQITYQEYSIPKKVLKFPWSLMTDANVI